MVEFAAVAERIRKSIDSSTSASAGTTAVTNVTSNAHDNGDFSKVRLVVVRRSCARKRMNERVFCRERDRGLTTER